MKNYFHILRDIKLVLTDLDGCLTDGGMYRNQKLTKPEYLKNPS